MGITERKEEQKEQIYIFEVMMGENRSKAMTDKTITNAGSSGNIKHYK